MPASSRVAATCGAAGRGWAHAFPEQRWLRGGAASLRPSRHAWVVPQDGAAPPMRPGDGSEPTPPPRRLLEAATLAANPCRGVALNRCGNAVLPGVFARNGRGWVEGFDVTPHCAPATAVARDASAEGVRCRSRCSAAPLAPMGGGMSRRGTCVPVARFPWTVRSTPPHPSVVFHPRCSGPPRRCQGRAVGWARASRRPANFTRAAERLGARRITDHTASHPMVVAPCVALTMARLHSRHARGR